MTYIEWHSKDKKTLVFKEITEKFTFDKSGMIVRGNHHTNCFFTLESLKPEKAFQELKDKIYDTVSQHYENWDEDIFFDSLRFGETGNQRNFYQPVLAYITIIE